MSGVITAITITANEWLRRESVRREIVEAVKERGGTAIVSDYGYGCFVVNAQDLDEEQLATAIQGGRDMARHKAGGR